MKWMRDDEFVRGDIPMTKFEVRTLVIGLLAIEESDILVDIGAGTGSISIEASLHGAKVYAIEREAKGIELIKKNAKKFKQDIEIIKDIAPKGLEKIGEYNKAFVGGSGGNIESIVSAISKGIQKNGIVVATFITIDNLYKFKEILKKMGYEDIETRLIQISMVEGKSELLKSQNPIFIVKGVKK